MNQPLAPATGTFTRNGVILVIAGIFYLKIEKKNNVKKEKTYASYPLWIVFVSNLLSLAIYAIGAFIVYPTGLVRLLAYLLYIAWLEVRLLRGSCVNCYYYGKACAFGKGGLSAQFFKKGSPGKFMRRHITWKDILPDFMVSIIPMIPGIVLLTMEFSWPILPYVILLLLLTSAGNGLVRGSLACPHCRQRELGCPAKQLFGKK